MKLAANRNKTLFQIEKLKRQRENRRKSAEEFKKTRQNEIKKNEQKGKPGDVDFQRMIQSFRENHDASILDASSEEDRLSDLNINVVVRKRPISEKEVRKKDHDAISCFSPSVYVHYCKLKVDGITKYLDNTKFSVDHVFDENSSNEEVYTHTVKNLVSFVLKKGSKATCFAYGQTGSGKTYTMSGIQALAVKDLFSKLVSKNGTKFRLYLSFFELYGGRCVDLLNNKHICAIREDGKGVVHIESLMEFEVNTEEELLDLIDKGNSIRTTHQTEMNNVSSRSHAICQINVKTSSNQLYSKLSLIDLAGSERTKDTKSHNKVRRGESAEINKSLLALKECIRALNSNNNNNIRHIPYRGSKLTMILKDSFSNKSKSVMISCISPVTSSTDHTLNTLRYATRVKGNNNSNTISRRQTLAPTLTTDTSSRMQKPRRKSQWGAVKDFVPEPIIKESIELESVSNNSNPTKDYSNIITKLVEEEEELIDEHEGTLREYAKLWAKERYLLSKVQQFNVEDSVIDEYTDVLEDILKQRQAMNDRLLMKVIEFKKHLNIESVK